MQSRDDLTRRGSFKEGKPDAAKGALEQDRRSQQTNTSLSGQLPHRTDDPLVKSSDSDFPEPGSNEEHTGEPAGTAVHPSPEPEDVDQDPGETQKRNQGDEKDDPLAA